MKKVEAKQARVVTDAIIHLLKPVQANALTITSDNGKEFRQFKFKVQHS